MNKKIALSKKQDSRRSKNIEKISSRKSDCGTSSKGFANQTARLSKKAQKTVASMVAVGVIGIGGLNFYASTNHFGQDKNERVIQKLELTESELSRQLELL